MCLVNHFNQLRQSHLVYRPHQTKWNKKILEYLIDICHINAFIIWLSQQPLKPVNQRKRKIFMEQLVQGLVRDVDNAHILTQVKPSRHCAYSDCKPMQYRARQPLGQISGNRRVQRSRRTYNYCDKCLVPLCVQAGCWQAYHEDKGLPVRDEECVQERRDSDD